MSLARHDRDEMLPARQQDRPRTRQNERGLGAINLELHRLAVQDRDGAGVALVGKLDGRLIDDPRRSQAGIQVNYTRRRRAPGSFDVVRTGGQPDRFGIADRPGLTVYLRGTLPLKTGAV